MFKLSNPLSAVLPNITGDSLPPIDLGILSEFQFCVNAGASAAVAFFGNLSDFNLHDHIAFALRSFSTSIEAGLAATGAYDTEMMQECRDAFAAGYLGRIQQELRLFHGEDSRRDRPSPKVMATLANVNTMN